MQSLRGPSDNARISAGKPATLVFDLDSPATEGNCRMQILDQDGKRVLETGTSLENGHVAAAVGKIARGDYWVRLYARTNGELLAEYSLRAE
jgi:hypothetical protein